MNQPAELINLLQCPECFNQSLIVSRDILICESCNLEFEKHDHAFVLLPKKERRESYGKFMINRSEEKDWKSQASWNKELEELIPNGSGYLLDFACGGGRRKWCEEKGYKYIGLDYYNDYGVDIIANGMNIPLKDNTLSCVTSSAVMEHIPDPWKACREIYRVLEKGGIYAGSTAFLYPYHERSHYNMTHLGVRLMLEQAGFEVIAINPSKRSGMQSIIRSMVPSKILALIIGFPFVFLEKSLMFCRLIGAKILLTINKNSAAKQNRIKEFIEEEPLRFTSIFYYVAIKK